MSVSIFFFRFFPLFIVVVFFKGVINFIFPLWFVDIFLAFALAFMTYFKFSFIACLAVFLIGIVRAFDGYYPTLFFSLLYVFIFWLKEVSNKFLKRENVYFIYIFWLLSITLVLFLQLVIFFIRLNLYSITYEFIFVALFKSLLWVGFTFLFSYLFFRLLRLIFDEYKDK